MQTRYLEKQVLPLTPQDAGLTVDLEIDLASQDQFGRLVDSPVLIFIAPLRIHLAC